MRGEKKRKVNDEQNSCWGVCVCEKVLDIVYFSVLLLLWIMRLVVTAVWWEARFLCVQLPALMNFIIKKGGREKCTPRSTPHQVAMGENGVDGASPNFND